MPPPVPKHALLVGKPDDPQLVAAQQALEHLGVEVQAVSARESDLASAFRAPAQLVILLEPSSTSGRSLIDVVRRQPDGARAPVLVLSGRPDRPVSLEWLSRGADLQIPCPPPEALLANGLAAAARLCEGARELEQIEERLRQAETTDPLTRLANHRQFHDRLHEEFLRCERYQKPLSLLFADLDQFRDINSTYGHKVGDGFLRSVAGFLSNAVRKVDLVARYQGEQFAVLLPETDAARAIQVAERLRTLTAGYIYKETDIEGPYQPLIKTTLSFGVATYPHPSVKNRHELVERALQALQSAQDAGRNRVSPIQIP